MHVRKGHFGVSCLAGEVIVVIEVFHELKVFPFFFFSQHDVFELECRLLLQSQKLNSVTTYMHVTNMCLFQCM